MKWKFIRIYKFDLTAETPYKAREEILEMEKNAPLEPHSEFAVEDKPDGFWKSFKKQIRG